MLNDVPGRIYRLLISRKFAITLLIAISVLLLLGILLPSLAYYQSKELANFSQKHPIIYELGKVFNPQSLTTSYTFLTLTGLLMLSTVLCGIERIRDHEYRDPYKAQPKFFRQRVKVEIDADPEEAARLAVAALRHRWWRLGSKRTQGEFVFLEGHKGQPGFWGSIIFHLGFLIILLGVIISSSTRFVGTFLLTEGQQMPLLIQNLKEIIKEPAGGGYELPGSAAYLEDFKPSMVDGRAVVYAADLKIIDQNGVTVDNQIKINQAVNYHDIGILLRNYGFSPRIVVKENKNKTLVDAYFNLKGRLPGSKDSLAVPKTKLKINTIFYPRFDQAASLKPTSLTYAVTVLDNDKRVFKGYLRRGGSIKFNGMTVSFPDARYWAYFQVSRDAGLDILFAGFIISFIGIVLRFVFHDRQISIRLKEIAGGTEIFVSGRCRFFPVMFKEELGRLAHSIESPKRGGVLVGKN